MQNPEITKNRGTPHQPCRSNPFRARDHHGGLGTTPDKATCRSTTLVAAHPRRKSIDRSRPDGVSNEELGLVIAPRKIGAVAAQVACGLFEAEYSTQDGEANRVARTRSPRYGYRYGHEEVIPLTARTPIPLPLSTTSLPHVTLGEIGNDGVYILRKVSRNSGTTGTNPIFFAPQTFPHPSTQIISLPVTNNLYREIHEAHTGTMRRNQKPSNDAARPLLAPKSSANSLLRKILPISPYDSRFCSATPGSPALNSSKMNILRFLRGGRGYLKKC